MKCVIIFVPKGLIEEKTNKLQQNNVNVSIYSH